MNKENMQIHFERRSERKKVKKLFNERQWLTDDCLGGLGGLGCCWCPLAIHSFLSLSNNCRSTSISAPVVWYDWLSSRQERLVVCEGDERWLDNDTTGIVETGGVGNGNEKLARLKSVFLCCFLLKSQEWRVKSQRKDEGSSPHSLHDKEAQTHNWWLLDEDESCYFLEERSERDPLLSSFLPQTLVFPLPLYSQCLCSQPGWEMRRGNGKTADLSLLKGVSTSKTGTITHWTGQSWSDKGYLFSFRSRESSWEREGSKKQTERETRMSLRQALKTPSLTVWFISLRFLRLSSVISPPESTTH